MLFLLEESRLSNEVVIAFIGLVGSAIGTFGGVLASTRLIAYRIEKLEKEVEKHNNVIERMFKLEGRMDTTEGIIRKMKGGKSNED